MFTLFEGNTYFISKPQGDCIIIDPGCSNIYEEGALKDCFRDNSLNVEYLRNAHFYIDHLIGNYFVNKSIQIANIFPEVEKGFLKESGDMLSEGFLGSYVYSKPDILIKIILSNYCLKVKEVPGHSPGHIILIEESAKLIFSGDTLFRESIGRGDLPGGNIEVLINDIKNKILSMREVYTIYPGHAEKTSLYHGKMNNEKIK